MIRILQVLGGLDCGGAETMVMNYYRYIDRNKIQFDFVIHTDKKQFYEEEIQALGGKIYHVPRYRGYNHFEYCLAWKKLFEEHPEYKIIHGHVRSTASIYLKIAKKYGLKTICHSHSISNGLGMSAIIKNILQIKIRYISDFFMGCSKKANQWLFGKKIANSNKCFVINNAINYEKFKFSSDYREEIRKKYHIQEECILIGHVGRFSKEKNHKYIVDILSQIYKKHNNFKLMLCGDGKIKKNIINYAKRKGVLQSIFFVEPTSEIYKYYSAFDILVFPSKYEGLGMVAIEAQVSGLRVITSTKIPKDVKISDKIDFLNIDFFNINTWIEKINSASKEKELYKRNIKVSHNYDIKTEVRRLEIIYYNIMEK